MPSYTEEDRTAVGNMEISIVIVTFNSAMNIADTIRAFDAATSHLSSELLVVDNGSTDRTGDVAESAVSKGRVIRATQNPGYGKQNRGYGAGANLGLAYARGTYCLMANDDVRLRPGCIEALMDFMDASHDVGLAAGQLIDDIGNPKRNVWPFFHGFEEELFRLFHRFGQRTLPGMDDTSEAPRDVAWLSGAMLFGRTDTLRQIGGFNERFFLYSEDVDISRRMSEYGHRRVLVPSAHFAHTESSTTNRSYDDFGRLKVRWDGRDVYYRLWYSRISRIGLNLLRAIGKGQQPHRARYYLRKVLHDGPSLTRYRYPEPIDGPRP